LLYALSPFFEWDFPNNKDWLIRVQNAIDMERPGVRLADLARLVSSHDHSGLLSLHEGV
jgi:hypothetical protein